MKIVKKTVIGLFAIAAVAALVFPLFSADPPVEQRQSLKVYISADMEGITGVVSTDQTSPGGREYEAARKWMTDDVNAAIEGAVRAGASEIIVNDAHGNMRNILPEDLSSRAILISGSPKPLGMMQGIDDSFNAGVFVGYHAQAGAQEAVLDHTFSSSVVRSVKVNGVEAGELGLNAAVAGAYGVPVVFVSGDVAVCKEAKIVLGSGVGTAPVKDGIGRTAARLIPIAEARRAIRDRVTEALRKLGAVKPYRFAAPCKFELEFSNAGQADMAVALPGVQRLGARTVAFQGADYIQGYKLLRALVAVAQPR
jgi:D-amino peptidase